jgi:hypothetical protein
MKGSSVKRIKMKTCTKCLETKPLTDFSFRKENNSYRSYCKKCKAIQDASSHKSRMEDPEYKEFERTRFKLLRENLNSEEIERIKAVGLARRNLLAEIKETAFAGEHGVSSVESKRLSQQDFYINKAKEVHGDKYSYDKFHFESRTVKTFVFCKYCNEYFLQTPKEHSSGKGCIPCGQRTTGLKLRDSKEEFLAKLQLIHPDKFGTELVDYVNNSTNVKLICKEHGEILAKPLNLLSGKGCRKCATFGFNTNKPANLYILTFDNLTKIGITNNTVKSRAIQISNSFGNKFEVAKTFKHDSGGVVADIETKLLRLLRSTHKQPTTKFDGSTECFYDVDLPTLITQIETLTGELNGN